MAGFWFGLTSKLGHAWGVHRAWVVAGGRNVGDPRMVDMKEWGPYKIKIHSTYT